MVSFDFGARVPLFAFGVATVLTLLLAWIKRKPDGKRIEVAQLLVYELALFFAAFIVLTLLNQPAVTHDIALGEPTF